MPPVAARPRLKSIQTEALRSEVVELVEGALRHFARVSDRVLPERTQRSAIGDDAARVLAFALMGRGANRTQVRYLCGALYSRIGENDAGGGAVPMLDPTQVVIVDGGEPERLVDVVLLAAETRAAIHAGERVTHRGLAALGSVSPAHVSRAVAGGELGIASKHDGRAGPTITAHAAARWLRARGLEIVAGGQ